MARFAYFIAEYISSDEDRASMTEMVVGAECKRFVDLWALGVLAYQISNYDFPFRNEDI